MIILLSENVLIQIKSGIWLTQRQEKGNTASKFHVSSKIQGKHGKTIEQAKPHPSSISTWNPCFTLTWQKMDKSLITQDYNDMFCCWFVFPQKKQHDLVGGIPTLWKIWVRQVGWWNSQLFWKVIIHSCSIIDYHWLSYPIISHQKHHSYIHGNQTTKQWWKPDTSWRHPIQFHWGPWQGPSWNYW